MAFDQIVESSAPVFDPIDLGIPPSPDIISWPWPRLVVTSYHTFLFMEGLEGSLLLSELTLDAGGMWNGEDIGVVGTVHEVDCVEVVDFGHYYVVLVSGETSRNFAKLIEHELVELVQPVFATGCNNNGQFIGGNVSNWQNLGSDSIAWSAIGNYEFSPEVDLTAGFKTLVSGKVPGKKVRIYKILPFTSTGSLSSTGGVIVYTDYGNVFLADSIVGSSFTYGLSELEGVGVASSNHIAGNTHTQMFVNTNNEICKYQRNKDLKILGYKRHVEILKESQTPLLMNFLEDRNTFFLSNGIQTLVINDYGAGMIHQAISGIIKGWDEKIYATFRDLGDTQGRITLDGTSIDSRGKKTFEWIISDISHLSSTSIVASSYWRNGASDEWRDFQWKRGSPSGEFFLGLSAVEYRPSLRFSNYVESEIFGIKANMKYPDSRTRRGIAAISGVNRSQGDEGGNQ